MKNDIRRYISMRESLIREKAVLEKRLREIVEALGENAQSVPMQRAPVAIKSRRARPGGLSLREAVLQVLSKGALTKEEILEGVKQLGYRFSTTNPLNSLGVILYGKNPRFKNQDGLFSPEGSNLKASRVTGTGNRKKRKLSPEARERIAAAQRARWAKTKGGK
jgi:hypothetical protein